jgi:rubrerythrin
VSKTETHLKEAFAGESQACQRYLAFAEKADREGQPMVARLFRAAAAAESIHAHNHLRALEAIGSTKDNLEEVIAGETHEFKQMYPEMIAAAQAEGHKRGLKTLGYANEVEKVHAELYAAALKSLGQAGADQPCWVCPTCGHTALGQPPEKCPVCTTLGKFYKKID